MGDQIKEPRWISADPQRHIVYEILISSLECAQSQNDAARRSLESTASSLLSLRTSEPTLSQFWHESTAFYAILLAIVKQLDAQSQAQAHLVALVATFRDLSLPENLADDIDRANLNPRTNTDLDHFIFIWARYAYYAPVHPPMSERNVPRHHIASSQSLDSDTTVTSQQWTSLNAFLARLHHTVPSTERGYPGVLHIDVRGLRAMMEALEEPMTPAELEDVLPAAACWIIYAGKELRTNIVPYAAYDDPSTRTFPWSRGVLWTGAVGFSKERWQFWMERFSHIARMSHVSATVRRFALAAVEAGEAVDREMD